MEQFPQADELLSGDVVCYREGGFLGLVCIVANESDADSEGFTLAHISMHERALFRLRPGLQFRIWRRRDFYQAGWHLYAPERYWHWYDTPTWEMCWATTTLAPANDDAPRWTIRTPSWQGAQALAPEGEPAGEEGTAEEIERLTAWLQGEGWISLELHEPAAYATWRLFRRRVLAMPRQLRGPD